MGVNAFDDFVMGESHFRRLTRVGVQLILLIVSLLPPRYVIVVVKSELVVLDKLKISDEEDQFLEGASPPLPTRGVSLHFRDGQSGKAREKLKKLEDVFTHVAHDVENEDGREEGRDGKNDGVMLHGRLVVERALRVHEDNCYSTPVMRCPKWVRPDVNANRFTLRSA
ncbi:uncharacterized protein LOC118435527 [Folsomia candida]|uniref:uncharacterized protein LOC118435527 n=1 Tax=Folsomia candida TaxID=158441 RepID=UPI0016054E4E|nr:uncharacterized protein LOC118435527 [Folsomia candida]